METQDKAVAQIRAAIDTATQNLIGRESLAELLMLAAVAGEHVLIIGPPGTAKSAAVRRVATALGGNYFEYLLGRFTEPSEIFGPVDLRKLREGLVETETSGMLPEADVAFLDEVFLGSTAILNTLLGVLNERQFKRGHTHIQCPLRLCVGASNDIPEEPSLAAFADRFLLHVFVEPVADNELESLLTAGWKLGNSRLNANANLHDLDSLSDAVKDVSMTEVTASLADTIRQLRKADIHLSDRRIVKAQRLIAAATVLAGRNVASRADLWPIIAVIPGRAEQETARDVLKDLLSESANGNLPSAVESAAMSIQNRADRLAKQVQDHIDTLGEGQQSQHAAPDWHEKARALLRDTDVNFTSDNCPEPLATARQALIQLVEVAVAAPVPEPATAVEGDADNPPNMEEPRLEAGTSQPKFSESNPNRQPKTNLNPFRR